MFKLCTILKKAPAQPTKHLLRTIFATPHQKTKQEPLTQTKENEEFEPIFRFPHMKMLVLLNRLKVYQTFAAGTTVPVTATLVNFNFIDLYTALNVCGIGFVACLPLYGLSFFSKDIVGFIYANKDATKTKIAYLNYWGKRTDIVVNSDDIIPFCEQPPSFRDRLYFKLCRHSTKDALKINVQHGKVLDYPTFSKIFSMPAYD